MLAFYIQSTNAVTYKCAVATSTTASPVRLLVSACISVWTSLRSFVLSYNSWQNQWCLCELLRWDVIIAHGRLPVDIWYDLLDMNSYQTSLINRVQCKWSFVPHTIILTTCSSGCRNMLWRSTNHNSLGVTFQRWQRLIHLSSTVAVWAMRITCSV